MNKIILVLMLLISPIHPAYAQTLENGFLTVYEGFFGFSGRLTGNIDTIGGTLQLNPVGFAFYSASFLATELLGPGTYARTHNNTTGGTISRTGTIPAGKTGAYFVISIDGNEYQIFNAWSVSADGLSYKNYNIGTNKAIGGTLNGNRLYTSFSFPAPPPPSLDLTVNMVGGLDQECNEAGGSTITANTAVVTDGGAILDRVEWWLDGVYQGDGSSKSLFIPLGGSSIDVIAYATDGVTSDAEVLPVTITDTLQPSLDIFFIDSSGNEVTTVQLGDYAIRFNVSDVCDPFPVVSGSAKPVMEVFDGDIITINSSIDVVLPTTAIEVTATAADVSGRSTVAQKVLIIQ